MIYIMPLNYSMHKRCYNIIITWSFCLIDSISSNDDDDDGYRRKKKVRTAFSREQVTELEKKFQEKKYLSSGESWRVVIT